MSAVPWRWGCVRELLSPKDCQPGLQDLGCATAFPRGCLCAGVDTDLDSFLHRNFPTETFLSQPGLKCRGSLKGKENMLWGTPQNVLPGVAQIHPKPGASLCSSFSSWCPQSNAVTHALSRADGAPRRPQGHVAPPPKDTLSPPRTHCPPQGHVAPPQGHVGYVGKTHLTELCSE